MDHDTLTDLLVDAYTRKMSLRIRLTASSIDDLRHLIALENARVVEFPQIRVQLSTLSRNRTWDALPSRELILKPGTNFGGKVSWFVGRCADMIEHAEIDDPNTT